MLTQHFYSQQVKGKVVSDSLGLKNVLVINITSQEKAYSDSYGQFIITANLGDEVRFLRDDYDRNSVIVRDSRELLVVLSKKIIEIEEVEVRKKLSGDLRQDSKLFDENRKKVTLNNDLKVYFKAPSSAELLKPKPGEFVQPVGSGIAFGKIDDKWSLTDLVEWIRENLKEDYFISMGLGFPEINSFLYYSLRAFNTNNILKYGYCNDDEVGYLKLHFEETFKKIRNK